MLLNGIRYHVYAQGRGSGTPTLFLHGFTGSSDNWRNLVIPSEYWMIAPDLLGHGQTESPADPTRYRMEHAAEDLIMLIREMAGEPVHLVGYSMGGRLALYLAVHYPQWISRLTLESASAGLANPDERDARCLRDEQLAARIEENGIEAFVNEWENLPLFETQNRLPAEVRARLREQRLQNNPLGLANSLRGMGTGIQPSLWDDLANLTMPVNLLAGMLDTKFTAIAQHMHALIPQSTLALVPDTGHTIHLEQPAAFIQALG